MNASARPGQTPELRPARIRVVIADAQAMFRQGLRRLLEGERDFIVLAEAADAEEGVALAAKLRPDIVLLNVSMTVASGLEALRVLASVQPGIKAVVLASEIDRDQVIKALQLGACGVMLKSSSAEMMFKALRTVMRGQLWVDRQTVTDLVQTLRDVSGAHPHAGSRFGLTARQLEIVSCVVGGLTNRAIAKKLTISEDTVKHHLTQIFTKTGVANRLELALFAMQHQLGENS